MWQLHVIFYIALAGAHDANSSVGLWKVACGDVMLDAVDKLGLPGYQGILDLNPGLKPECVQAGETYTVPFAPAVPPATWTSSDGNAVFELRHSRTQGCQVSPSPAIITTQGATQFSAIAHSTSTTVSLVSSARSPTQSLATEGFASGTRDNPKTSLDAICSGSTRSSEIFQGLKCHQRGELTTDEGFQESYATRFCNENGVRDLDNQSDSISTTFWNGNGHFYRYTISWIPNCQSKTRQSVATSSTDCSEVMIDNFKRCKSIPKAMLH